MSVPTFEECDVCGFPWRFRRETCERHYAEWFQTRWGDGLVSESCVSSRRREAGVRMFGGPRIFQQLLDWNRKQTPTWQRVPS